MDGAAEGGGWEKEPCVCRWIEVGDWAGVRCHAVVSGAIKRGAVACGAGGGKRRMDCRGEVTETALFPHSRLAVQRLIVHVLHITA